MGSYQAIQINSFNYLILKVYFFLHNISWLEQV